MVVLDGQPLDAQPLPPCGSCGLVVVVLDRQPPSPDAPPTVGPVVCDVLVVPWVGNGWLSTQWMLSSTLLRPL